MIAYCYATGRIEFGRTCPDGAIEMARGPAEALRKLISATARLAYDNVTLLVPGVPEAPNETAAYDALVLHLRWLKRNPGNITIATRQRPLPLFPHERRQRRAQS